MEKRVHMYVNRKNAAVRLMALCMIASAAARIIVCAGRPHYGIWTDIVLPAAAGVLYALTAVIAGEEMFYRTALPVWLFGLSKLWQLHTFIDNPATYGLAITGIILFCAIYSAATNGRLRRPWLLLPLYLALFTLSFFAHRWDLSEMLPDFLLLLGMLVLLFAVKVHSDENYHPRWGDRTDGRRIRSLPAMDRISPYIMVDRTGAGNLFSASVEITALERYIHRKRREGLAHFGLMHTVIAAYVRTVAKYPGLNRFIAGQRLYSRGEDISMCMTVKKEMSASSPDTVVKVHLSPRDTAADVYAKFNSHLEDAKNDSLDSGVDHVAGILSFIPGLMLKFAVWLLKALDYFGLIPLFLLEVSPFHGSVYFTSMGSLGILPVYHHLYDFGTIPVFCAFGHKRHAEEIKGGEIVKRKYLDIKFNLDERICDGYYYAGAIKHFLRLLEHPDLLDMPPAAVEKDIP